MVRMKKLWCMHRVYTMLLVLQILFCFCVNPANAEPMQSANEKSIESKDTSVGFCRLMELTTEQKQDNENDVELLYVLCGLLVLYVGTKVFVSHTDDKKNS